VNHARRQTNPSPPIMPAPTFCCLAGTPRGVFRISDQGDVTPLGPPDALVSSLALSAKGEVVVGTSAGQILRHSMRNGRWEQAVVPEGLGGISSLARLPGSSSSLLAGTETGQLLRSNDDGDTFGAFGELPPGAAPPGVQISVLPDQPRQVAVLSSRGAEIVHLEDQAIELVPGSGGIRHLAIHPRDHELWFALTADSILRSIDRGSHWTVASKLQSSPRSIFIERWSPYRILILSRDSDDAPAHVKESSLSTYDDHERSLRPLPSSVVDRPCDPTGEITCAAFVPAPQDSSFVYATDRGEVVQVFLSELRAELIASGLPPIHRLLCAPADLLDPSRSGIYLLP